MGGLFQRGSFGGENFLEWGTLYPSNSQDLIVNSLL